MHLQSAAIETFSRNSVISVLPQDFATSLSGDALKQIDNYCLAIDGSLHTVKKEIIEIGRALANIRHTLREQTVNFDSTQMFELVVEKRFGKKKSWAYQLISIYETFNSDDPLLDLCAVSSLREISRLEPTQIDTIRTRLEGGEKLNRDQIHELITMLKTQEATQTAEIDEQMLAVATEKKRLEAQLDARTSEIDQLNRELQTKTKSNDDLLNKLRESQSEQSNLFSSLKFEREKLETLRSELEAAKKKSSKSATVEVDVVPAGYKTIEDAIAAATESLEEKEKELSALNVKIDEMKVKLYDEKSALNQLNSLYAKYHEISLSQMEIFNKTKLSDLQGHSALLTKIREIASDLAKNINLQLG
ncbi:hypothetical protein [Undibacterium oligocarboniphilum]|uniref:Uncharacterized protein n=1 Tax=Undibacterium oligocarboniphilum TaxID=666702 RepID=A0A850QMV0_9BURK|nr:hypothetical protein [Undibacterium oligocarboniphilum]MBC3871459.1 hypothetical protein [Undibacterium oligocarboniphilum]NVO78965.1 hypothetical protein [Undibacterium oligocarboniphilum]